MRQLVECIPNFSEGRRMEVIDRIVTAIAAEEGVQVLDRESDADHNRTVVTFVGAPEPVLAAAFAAIRTAAELINLDEHQGAHPRIGATDVVPFIPLEGLTMADCVILAKRLGARVGDELGIPVFLYEAAATRPEFENLATVRAGEYEGLKQAIETDPKRHPDFGPARLGTAGATVIGARAPLIAFNVYLNTADVQIARNIAKAVRHQTGGLRFVKALGLLVDGKAQVSMNLTNYVQTPVYRVVEMVRREAQRYGALITHSELVGLIPQQALFDSAQWYLQLDNLRTDQVLETRLTALPADSSFLNALASADPTPGGGSAAAYSGAMAAALVAMVARLTVGKKKYAEVDARMQDIITQAEAMRADLDSGVQRDADAFASVMAAFRLPKETPDQQAAREQAVQAATFHAAEVPLQTATSALMVMELALEAARTGNTNAITDAATATQLAHTAIAAAGYNVAINLSSLPDGERKEGIADALSTVKTRAAALLAELPGILHDRAQINA